MQEGFKIVRDAISGGIFILIIMAILSAFLVYAILLSVFIGSLIIGFSSRNSVDGAKKAVLSSFVASVLAILVTLFTLSDQLSQLMSEVQLSLEVLLLLFVTCLGVGFFAGALGGYICKKLKHAKV